MAEESSSVFIEDGVFAVNKAESMRLHGHYYHSIVPNKATLPEDYHEFNNIPLQSVYVTGNVLIRQNTENIKDLIDIFIKYTHDPCEELKVDIINQNQRMVWGTICPTKKTLFRYNSKVFVAYGRYIYGYDEGYVTFRRLEDENKIKAFHDKKHDYKFSDEETSSDEKDNHDSDVDPEDKIFDEIKNNRIILKTPKYLRGLDEYVYAFCIYDEQSNIVDAFGLYR